MVDKLIAALKGRNFDQFEIYHEESNASVLVFKGGKFYETKQLQRQGFGTRVIKEKKLGFMSGTDIDFFIKELPALKPIFETNVELPPPADYQDLKLSSDAVSGWSEDKLKTYGEEAIANITELNPELKLEMEVARRFSNVAIRNSRGLDANYNRLVSYYWIEGQLVKNGHIFYIFDFTNLSAGDTPDFKENRKFFDLVLKNIDREVTVEPGSYQVLILPATLSSLISSIKFGVSGKAMEKGYSPLIDKRGERFISEKITIYDDGLLPFCFGTAPFDGEGIAKNRKTLFEKGVFKDFIFDLETGIRNKTGSTGNAQRGYATLPAPGVNNLVIEPGAAGLLNTISKIDNGILVASVVGGGHGNIYAGDFSVKVDLGFLIKNGEIAGRLIDTMMAGNTYKMLNNVIEVGKDQKNLGNEIMPWMLVSNLKFATPQQDLLPK